MLWDIGAGAGSIGIEWMLADPSLKAVGIEERPERAARIRRNAASLGVPGLEIVEGAAPEALAGLPAPDAIFIGGGARDAGVLDAALTALKSGGRLVVNAVTSGDRGAADRAAWPRAAASSSGSPSPARRRSAGSPAGGRPCR